MCVVWSVRARERACVCVEVVVLWLFVCSAFVRGVCGEFMCLVSVVSGVSKCVRVSVCVCV